MSGSVKRRHGWLRTTIDGVELSHAGQRDHGGGWRPEMGTARKDGRAVGAYLRFRGSSFIADWERRDRRKANR